MIQTLPILSLRYTRNLFLRAFCTVYLAAFLSLYFQASGLYGENGILPARSVLENSKHKTFLAKIHYQPTLLWLAPYLGLSTSAAVDVLSLLGVMLAFTGIVSQKFCIVPVFTALWSLFFSLYQIGQVFASNGYDELLLEAGFLAILVAPFVHNRRKAETPTTELISFWLCRWLLFRLLFTTALGKMLSGCPKWWTMSALEVQFETMPLPNPLSWYAHHLPTWILTLGTVYTNICELIVPFMFFLPVRATRMASFHLEMFLQICIAATGNFGHANILIVTLLLSLLDDEFFYGKKMTESTLHIFEKIINMGLLSGVIFAVAKFYGLKYSDGILETQIALTKVQFNVLVEHYLPYVITGLVMTFISTVFLCIYLILMNHTDIENKKLGIISALFYTVIALVIFLSSTTTLYSVHPRTNSTINPFLRATYNRLHKARIVNQYNLFPKMTGTEGRPEIILEGTDNLEGQWKEYNFLYKPANVNHSLPFVAPYSPRLDWQLYWAAQSTYDKQPWLLSLTHRLLIGQPEALALIDQSHSPFAARPPKYIRAILYKYRYTTWNQRSQAAWWVREKVGEYFPPYSKDSPALEDFLKARNLLPSNKPEDINPIWKQILEVIRFATNKFEATLFFWSVFTATLAIVAFSS